MKDKNPFVYGKKRLVNGRVIDDIFNKYSSYPEWIEIDELDELRFEIDDFNNKVKSFYMDMER